MRNEPGMVGDHAKWTSGRVGLIALALFGLACFLPCIDGGSRFPSGDPGWPDFNEGVHFGLMILLLGHYGGGNFGVPWSANIFFFLGLGCLWARWFRFAAAYGIIASVLGLTTWAMNSFSRPHNIHVMVGYYFWQASLLVLAFGTLRLIRGRANFVGNSGNTELVEEITLRKQLRPKQ